MVNPRDVEIDLIGRDRTDRATRDAANNLDRLSRKIDSFNRKVGKDSKQGGVRSGTAFVESFTATATAGMDRMFARIGRTIRMSPRAGVLGTALGATVGAAVLAQASKVITAGLPLLLGGGLLAGPVAFLVKQQTNASKNLKAAQKRRKALQDTIANPHTSKTGRASARWKLNNRTNPEIKALEDQLKRSKRLRQSARGFMEDISKPLQGPFNKTLDMIAKWFDRMKKPVKDLMKELAPILKPFTGGILKGIEAFVKAIKPAMPGIKAGMKAWGDNFPKIAKAVGDLVAHILKDPEAVKKAVDDITRFIEFVARHAGSAMTGLNNLATGLDNLNNKAKSLKLGEEFRDIQKAIDDFENRTDSKGGPLAAMVDDLKKGKRRFQESFEQFRGWIEPKFENLSRMVKSKARSAASGIKNFFKGIPGWLSRNATEATNNLKKHWGEAKNAVSSRAQGAYNAVRNWFGKIPGWVRRNATEATNSLKQRWGEAKTAVSNRVRDLRNIVVNRFTELKNRVVTRATELRNSFVTKMTELKTRASNKVGEVKGAILSKFSGAGDWLRAKGSAVVNGLYRGMRQPWDTLKKWVSGIAKWIKDHKGPVSLDRQLLVPAGKALMGGLLEGLKFGFGPVGEFVHKAGSRVSDAVSSLGGRKTVNWHGGRFTERFRNTLENAQSRWGGYIPVTQGGFRPRTSYSGTSHAGDAIDTTHSSSLLRALRRSGVAAWLRGPPQGMPYHIHGIPLPGFGWPGGSGIGQAMDYLRGGDGLNSGSGFSTTTGLLRGGVYGSRRHPDQVSVAAPNVSTRVFLDSREIAAVVRTTVVDENRRSAHRARVGSR